MYTECTRGRPAHDNFPWEAGFVGRARPARPGVVRTPKKTGILEIIFVLSSYAVDVQTEGDEMQGHRLAISLRIIYQFSAFTLALIATGCGGGGPSSPPPPPPPAVATPVFWPVPGSYSQTQAG